MSVTGTLDILGSRVGSEGSETRRLTWNGDPDDRAAARAAFDEIAAQGGYLATVLDAPGKATQVRSFDEVEQIERERGTVAVQVSRQVVGG